MRALLERAEDAVEQQDLGELKPLVSERYADDRGQDKRAVEGLLTYYFFRNQAIHLLTRIASLALSEPERAEVVVFVGMAGRPIAGPEELGGLRADLYRFEFSLAQEDGSNWRVTRASWRPAAASDFL